MANETISASTPLLENIGNGSRVVDGVLEVWGSVLSIGDPAQTIVFDTTSGVFANPPHVLLLLGKQTGDSFAASVGLITTADFEAKRSNLVADGSTPSFEYRAIGAVA
jgi:hypothetical protein